MKPINNWENVEAQTGDFKKLPAGGYIAVIKAVADKADKEYLEVIYDIAEGEFKGFYGDDFGTKNPWSHRMIRSYKEKAAGMFKGFTEAVEASNKKYKWDWDESKLVGKLVGIVLGEVEYEKTNGEVGKRLEVRSIKTVQDIKDGNYNVPDVKKLEGSASAPDPESPVEGFSGLADNDIPF